MHDVGGATTAGVEVAVDGGSHGLSGHDLLVCARGWWGFFVGYICYAYLAGRRNERLAYAPTCGVEGEREGLRGRWMDGLLTSASGAVRAVAVGADIALAHDLAIDVFGVVRVDVACAAAAVGYFRGRHCCGFFYRCAVANCDVLEGLCVWCERRSVDFDRARERGDRKRRMWK